MHVQTNGWEEIDKAVFEVGKKALDLIQPFLSGRLSRAKMLEGLTELRANEMLTKYWDQLTSDARFVPHWQVLQTLQGLVDEMAYQLEEYGESTLHEDIKGIATSLKCIAEQNNGNK